MYRFSLTLFYLLLLFFIFSCGVFYPFLEPCENTGNQSFTCDTELNFSSCVEHYRTVVRDCRLDLEQNFSKSFVTTIASSVNSSITESYNADFIVKYAAPFELIPDANVCVGEPKKGIALVHGYSDGPYVFKSLAEYLQSKCFTVRVMLLPGNATRVGDLAKVSYQDWLDATLFVVSTFVNDDSFKEVYVGGFSTGVSALVVVLDQLKSKDRINGFFMFSPAFSILNESNRFATALSKILKFATPLLEEDEIRYKNDSYAAIGELNKLFSIARDIAIVNNITIPVFLYFSREDSTINQKVTLEIFEQNMLATQSVAHVVYSSTVGSLPNSIESRVNYIDIVKNIGVVQEGVTVISASHIFSLVHPEDPFYGRLPLYKRCLHFSSDNQMDLYNICMSNDDLRYLGEPLDVVLNNKKFAGFRRLSYNPLYQNMLSLIDNFLNSL